MNKIIFILGPTSSGKTDVAVKLAEKLNGEIISCDSMQVYQDMDILTRPPSKDITEHIPHHLVRMIPPEEEFNAARFIDMALEAIKSIIAKGKLPIFAGGTGLYVKALVDGIFSSPAKDESFRRNMQKIAIQKGKEYLLERLCEIDPVTAEKLHVNDTRRIIRALEVYHLTGSTIHEKKDQTKPGIAGEYDLRLYGLNLPREILYLRINDSVEHMFEQGLVGEVEKLIFRDLSLTAGKALGIKEVKDYLDARISLDQAKEELKKNTRKYAKRQLTWFRADKRITWINADKDAGEVAGEIAASLCSSQ
ncbi:MAG: tRNA (adenosine(37)-N6)-dimethylallyltransferase MiaA [Candidatus Omnitrophota bacterium]